VPARTQCLERLLDVLDLSLCLFEVLVKLLLQLLALRALLEFPERRQHLPLCAERHSELVFE
jgi:hypothetical protein